MNSKTTFNATRFDDIDRAVGFAIILVVMGHMFYPELQQGWYAVARDKIYKFHMPLFFALSGFLAFLSVSKHTPQSLPEYQTFVGKRIQKFLPPYVFITLLYWTMEFALHGFSWQKFNDYVWCWIFAPASGCPTFIWYIYILFFFYMVTPLLVSRTKGCWVALVLTAPLTVFEVTKWFSANMFAKYSVFFIAGGLLYIYWEPAKKHISRFGLVYMLFFLSILSCELLTKRSIPFQVWSVFAIPSIIYLAMAIPAKTGHPIALLGRYCFAIYLFHTIIINILYVLKKKYLGEAMSWDVFVAVGFLFGLLGPLLIRKIFNAVVPAKVYQL